MLLGGLATSHYSFTYRPGSGLTWMQRHASSIRWYLRVYAKLHSAAIITWELSDKFHLNSCRSITTLDVHKTHVRYTRQRLEFQVECDMWDAHSDFAEEQVFWDVIPCRLIITDVSRKCNAVIFKVRQVKFQVECDMWDAHSDFAEESGLLGCYTVPTDNYRRFEEM